jgi:hypothetical protein
MHPDLLATVLSRNIGPAKSTTEVAGKTDAQSDLRMGTVTAVTTRGITVDVGAQTVDAAHLDSYAPAVGDPVALMKVQDSWLALGRVVGPGNASDLSLLGGGIVTTSRTTSTAAGPVNISGWDIDFWLPPNHAALIVAGFPYFGSIAGSVGQMTLVVVGSGNIAQLRRTAVTANIAQMETLTGVVMPSSLGRAIEVVAQLQFISGTGTSNVNGFTVTAPSPTSSRPRPVRRSSSTPWCRTRPDWWT